MKRGEAQSSFSFRFSNGGGEVSGATGGMVTAVTMGGLSGGSSGGDRVFVTQVWTAPPTFGVLGTRSSQGQSVLLPRGISITGCRMDKLFSRAQSLSPLFQGRHGVRCRKAVQCWHHETC